MLFVTARFFSVSPCLRLSWGGAIVTAHFFFSSSIGLHLRAGKFPNPKRLTLTLDILGLGINPNPNPCSVCFMFVGRRCVAGAAVDVEEQCREVKKRWGGHGRH